MKIFSGMLVALVGVLIIIFAPIFLDGQKMIFGEIEGNIFFLVATLGAVFQTIFGKKVLKEVNSYLVTFISFVFGSLTFLPFALKEMNNWSFQLLNINGWIGIIFGVIFSSALAYFLFYYGIGKIQAQEVGVFTYIDPVVAVLLAIPLLGEYPNLFFFLGSLLVFGGIYLAEGRIHYHPFHKLKTNPTNPTNKQIIQ